MSGTSLTRTTTTSKFSSGAFGCYTRSLTQSHSPRCSIQQATITPSCNIASANCLTPSWSSSVARTSRRFTTLHARHAWRRSKTEVSSTHIFGYTGFRIYEWLMHRYSRLLWLDIQYVPGFKLSLALIISYCVCVRLLLVMRSVKRWLTSSRVTSAADVRAKGHIEP